MYLHGIRLLTTVVHVVSSFASALDSLNQEIWNFFVAHPFFVDGAKAVTSLGVVTVLLPMAVVAGVVVWWKTRSAVAALVPWVSVQLSTVVIASLKEWTAVVRPPGEFWLVTAQSGSFPSGHVGNTTALVVSVVFVTFAHFPQHLRKVQVAGGMAVLAMGWSRLALNVHWFSDVVGGALTGIAIAFVVVRTAERFRFPRVSQLQTPDQRED